MAPVPKAKRQPEPWNQNKRKKKVVQECVDDAGDKNGSDHVLSLGATSNRVTTTKGKNKLPVTTKGKRKPPPGPDAIASLEEEFYRISRAKQGPERTVLPQKEVERSVVDNVEKACEDDMVPTISDTNPGHGPGLKSGDHLDRGTSHWTPVVQVSTDIPPVMSTPNHNSRPCRGPSELHYNLSTDDEEIEACPVTEGGRDNARHGAGIRWERDITYSPRYPAYDEGRDYRMGRRRRSYTPSDESDGYRRRYAHRTASSEHRRMKEREWYYRHEIEDRDIPGRSRDSCFEDTGSHRLRRQYTRSPSPYTPLSHGSRPPQEMLRESASKRHSAGGVDTTDMMKGENLSNYNTPRKMFLSSLTLKTESILRRERMAKQVEREVDMEKRMQAGERRTYVNVNEDGKPYGLGITAWNDALGKLVRSLDPSFIDIRHQPFHLMEVLMNRMNEDFEYSSTVNPSWFRTRVGNALSSYRHELIKMIQAQEERPAWVKENVWEKLKELESSEKFRVKSEQMRYANSCRRTKGRTGPLGEVGITERLRRQLGRHPDPEEVQEEMRRDKGYSGRVRSVHPTRGLEDTGTYKEAEKALNSKSSGPSISMRSPLSHMCNQAHVSAAGDNICEETLPQEPEDGKGEDGILKSNEEPLIRILMQQIEDLKKIKSGNPGDVNIVIMSLMQQVLNLKGKNASTDCNIGLLPEDFIDVEVPNRTEVAVSTSEHEVQEEVMEPSPTETIPTCRVEGAPGKGAAGRSKSGRVYKKKQPRT